MAYKEIIHIKPSIIEGCKDRELILAYPLSLCSVNCSVPKVFLDSFNFVNLNRK